MNNHCLLLYMACYEDPGRKFGHIHIHIFICMSDRRPNYAASIVKDSEINLKKYIAQITNGNQNDYYNTILCELYFVSVTSVIDSK